MDEQHLVLENMKKIAIIETTLVKLSILIAEIQGEQHTTIQLLRYVVTPLIIILGSLIGIKLFV